MCSVCVGENNRQKPKNCNAKRPNFLLFSILCLHRSSPIMGVCRVVHARYETLAHLSVHEITELYDRAQVSSHLIFPINICLCAEESSAVQLMIRITAACLPTTHAACWEPDSLRGLRSVTHSPPPPHLHLPSPFDRKHAEL